MKANRILFSALAVTLISAYNMSPSELAIFKNRAGRLPASEEEVEMPEVRKQEVKSQEIKKDELKCIAESKGEKLEKEVKSQSQVIETILKEIGELKKEKVTSKKEKLGKLDKQDKLSEVDSRDTVGVMLAMTSLFTTQMQSQMEMQIQMMSLFAQMQMNQAPQYSWDLSKAYDLYGKHANYETMGIGIPASGVGGYINPYSQNPQLVRQPAAQMGFGFSYGEIPQANGMRGFDFNLAPSEPLLPQLKREMIPQQLPNPTYSI